MRMVAVKSKQSFLLLGMLLTLAAALLPGGWAAPVMAETAVKLEVKPGIGGEYKDSGMTPVRVTVINNGADLEGDVVISPGDGSEPLSVAYYQPISVAKGATKTVTLMVSGSDIGPNTSVEVKKGNETIAKASLGGRRYSSDTLMVGVLAADPDTANFLGALPKNKFTNMISVQPMKADQIPAAGSHLQMIDMLVLNNFALDSLTGEQIQAIKDWTAQGGLLVLAGGPHFGKTAGALAELSPVAVNGVTSVTSLNSLLVETDKPFQLQQPFTLSKATVKTGKVIYSEGDVPLMAVRTLMDGKVLYVAYDLAEEPLASWSGNSRLWAEVLNKAFGSSLYDHSNERRHNLWPLDEASDRIPSLKMPAVPWMALMFGLYALVAGPILFFILRSKRKQGYMWVMVPAFAIVTGVGIFSYGAIQRGTHVIVHSAGMIEFQPSGQARAAAVTTVFVPRSDDYQLNVKGEGNVWPMDYRRSVEEPVVWLSAQPDQTRVQFRDVEFWSVRKLGSERVIPNAGGIVSDLTYQDGKLIGTVTNKSAYALRDVKLVAGRDVIDLPPLGPGASTEVKMNFDTAFQNQPGRRYGSNRQLLPQSLQTGYGEQESREWTMLDMLETESRFQADIQDPIMLVAWSDQAAVELEVKDESVRTETLTLVTAPLTLKPSPDGSVFYPAGTFEAVKTEGTVDMHEEEGGYRMQAGEITFEFDLKQEGEKLQVTKVNLYTWSADKTPFDKQVYNWTKKAYEPYDRVFANNILSGEKLNSFLSPEGTLRVKFSHGLNDYRHIGIPVVSVEGKVTKP